MYNSLTGEKAMVLISVLMLTVLLVMMTTSMLVLTSTTHNLIGNANHQSNALIAAKAGLEFARYNLDCNTAWGDPNTPDIIKYLGTNQEFHITFNSTKLHHSTNNLAGDVRIGTTPRYSAEIISEGIVKVDGSVKGRVLLRAIFVRDDDYPCPVYSAGTVILNAMGTTPPEYTLTGSEDPNKISPVRIHSNTETIITGEPVTGSIVDLDQGYASSCDLVTVTDIVTTPFFTKEMALPMKIAEIDVNSIISSRPTDPNKIQDLPSDKFYLAGYFEYDPYNPDDPNDPKYDPNAPEYDPNVNPYNPEDDPYDPNDDPNNSYLIPHSSDVPLPSDPDYPDPQVHSSNFLLGIASFSENSFEDFMNNYGYFYYSASDKDFFDLYSDIEFLEYDSDPNSDFQTVEDEMGMSMSYALRDPNDPGSMRIITLTLTKHLYVSDSSVNGIFETDWIGVVDGSSPDEYYPDSMDNVMVKLDLNDRNIYGGKLWLGIPPCGAGSIISNKTVDFIQSCETETILTLSGESVRISYREPARQNGSTVSYRGIIYGKDDILIQANTSAERNSTLKILGSMVCNDFPPGNCSPSPFLYYTPALDPNTNFYIEGKNLADVVIVRTEDGLGDLAALRGKDFTIRMVLCQTL